MVFVYIFIGLILLLLIVAALMPKSFNIEKTIVILRSPENVMEKISNLNYYSEWNPWQQTDPSAQKTITGTPGQPGHRYEWTGKKVGKGHLTVHAVDASHVHLDLQFLKPWKSRAKDNWHFERWGDGDTKVTWQNSGELPWPIARLMGPMLNKSLSHQFEKGLQNLKQLCETGSVRSESTGT